MLTEKQYKREYIRMMDSLRKTYCGHKNCNGVMCSECPIRDICDVDNFYEVFKVIEIVEKWSKEHPYISNAKAFEDKFHTAVPTLIYDAMPEFWDAEFTTVEEKSNEF